MTKRDHKPFYKKGLQFECTKCGKCCTGFPGYVYLSETDIEKIAEFLHMNTERFLKKYTKRVRVFNESRFSLTEKVHFDCIFLDKLCTIYSVRPYQCKTYPFWKRHLVSEREWIKTGEFCPGINRGKLHLQNEIDNFVNNVPNYDFRRFSYDPSDSTGEHE